MAASEEQAQKLTFRKYEEGDSQWQDFKKQIFNNFKNLNDYKKFIEPKKSFLSSIKVIYL